MIDTTGNSTENITLQQTDSTTLKINLKMIEGTSKVYVKIQGKYYELTVTDGTITLSEDGITDITGEEYTIKLTPTTGKATMKFGENTIENEQTIVSGAEIIVTATETMGEENFTIKVEDSTGTQKGTKTGTITVVQKPIHAESLIIKEKDNAEDNNTEDNPKEITVGDILQLTAVTNPSTITDTIEWKSSDDSIATVDSTGLVTGKTAGEVTITATTKDSDGNSTQSATYKVTVTSIIGDYVEYGVSYTDMYTSFIFNATTNGVTAVDGWRILYPGNKNNDGSYSGATIISTGVPAKLYYHYSTNAGNANNGWWGTDTQVTTLFTATYAIGYSIYPSRYAAAGLQENFASIPLTGGATSTTANKGYYTSINNSTSAVNGGVFIISGKASEVHNLTLAELNTARGESETSITSTLSKDADTGLFYLRGLAGNYGYTLRTTCYYWLASPGTNTYYNLKYVDSSGNCSYSVYDSTYGVRPVVSLSSDIYKVGDIWKIK
jgi:hypothetical protein